MSIIKYVNEKIIDTESPATRYLAGISTTKYLQLIRGRSKINIWQSNSKPVIDKVQSILESKHKIYTNKIRKNGSDTDYSRYHRLEFSNAPIYDALKAMGFGVPYVERTFPSNIPEQFLNHQVRGFVDAHSECKNEMISSTRNDELPEYRKQTLTIHFNQKYLQKLLDTLVQHANVEPRKKITEPHITFTGTDIDALYHFMYRDWEFIQESGLYLESKKELFEPVSVIDPSNPLHKLSNANNRISPQNLERVMNLFGLGYPDDRVAFTIGYPEPETLHEAIFNTTGQTIDELLQNNASA